MGENGQVDRKAAHVFAELGQRMPNLLRGFLVSVGGGVGHIPELDKLRFQRVGVGGGVALPAQKPDDDGADIDPRKEINLFEISASKAQGE